MYVTAGLELASMPKEAVEHAEVHRYLSQQDSKYDAQCSENRKRTIRRFSAHFVLQDGLLIHVQEKEKGSEVQLRRRWVNDKKEQQQILKSVHDSSAGGCHFGRDKTRDKIASRFYWPSMYEDIDNYVRTCEKCQKVQYLAYVQEGVNDHYYIIPHVG